MLLPLGWSCYSNLYPSRHFFFVLDGVDVDTNGDEGDRDGGGAAPDRDSDDSSNADDVPLAVGGASNASNTSAGAGALVCVCVCVCVRGCVISYLCSTWSLLALTSVSASRWWCIVTVGAPAPHGVPPASIGSQRRWEQHERRHGGWRRFGRR